MQADPEPARSFALSVRYGWLLVLLLTPLLAGGVVVGDEALLLKLAHGLGASGLPFGVYARSPEGWYIFHHILWFAIIYATVNAAVWLGAGLLMTEAVISLQTVAAALAGIMLCYIFLVRWRGLSPTRAVWAVLAFFAGGYGVYVFCMGGMAESYMVLAMAGRLFFLDPRAAEGRDWKLAVLDAVLVTFKAYSLIFIVVTLPLFWTSASGRDRRGYLGALGGLLLALAAVKLWLWNPPATYFNVFEHLNPLGLVWRWVQQFFSPWTGLLFCLPVLLVLFWHDKADRGAVLLKVGGLGALAAFFSLFSFFDGDLPGGRYIFPFIVALLPEIAAAADRLLNRHPGASWLLPVAVTAFLPVAALGLPFPARIPPSTGPCLPVHPILYSGRIALAAARGEARTSTCFRGKRYVMTTRDLASPHLGPWRLAYLLQGGHTARYRQYIHDPTQQQHDIWGARVADRLRRVGLGSPWLWKGVGSIPAILVIWLSLMAALRISRLPARARHPMPVL